MATNDSWARAQRLGGLRRFGVAITILNVLGHTFFGFEQSWAQPLVALATAYTLELLLETFDAWKHQRRPGFLGGPRTLIDFLLSAHITGLAVAMLLYANDELWPVAFASAAAIASKVLFRVPAGSGTRHFLNPSNFGITLTLLFFPRIGIAQPYQFTENLGGLGDLLLPAVIVCSGTFVNYRFTGRLPLIGAWLAGFAAQAIVRSLLAGTPVLAALAPMTGVAFILFTFYMVTDPATTPSTTGSQIAFGLGVAAAYWALMSVHIVFGLFFGLTMVCLVRGLSVYAQIAASWWRVRVTVGSAAPMLARDVPS